MCAILIHARRPVHVQHRPVIPDQEKPVEPGIPDPLSKRFVIPGNPIRKLWSGTLSEVV
jgi:hypothetical protein